MWRKFALACLISGACAVAAFSQTSGRIQGTVTDAQGGVIPGAEIKVVNKVTGQAFEALSNELGAWSFPSMPSATYTVSGSLPGFKTTTIDNVKVDAGVPATVNMKLEVGAVTDTVEWKPAPRCFKPRRQRSVRFLSVNNFTSCRLPAAISRN